MQSGRPGQYVDIKRKIRKLKKLEIKIRFESIGLMEKPEKAKLVWDIFFDLHDTDKSGAKYTLKVLSSMDKEAVKNVIDEFFTYVYYMFYKENGLDNLRSFDPEILSYFGLPADADHMMVKKRFRELAMRYHPDTGGDAGSFIEMMDQYNKLLEGYRDK